MNCLDVALQDYLRLRRGLGFKLRAEERRLMQFLQFMKQRNATYITRQLALEWATERTGREPSWAIRLADVRGFARYLVLSDPRTEIPPCELLRRGGRAKPYLYTEDEICRLIRAAEGLPPATGLRRWTYSCLFGLLAVTGMRISEALNLGQEDVDLEHGVLTIRDTKFGKTRLIPLHLSSHEMLKRYALRRDTHIGSARSRYFLVAERGGRLHVGAIYDVFYLLTRQIGIRDPQKHTGPRLHDFRHRLAVENILGWYRAGDDVEARLPSLSTFMGHSSVRETYWYLSACPDLMQEAANRLEKRWEEHQ
jgi:integrase